jgi:copper chaperone NosL
VKRRAHLLLVAAAVLTVASLALPLWGVRMTAPQYPDEALMLRIGRAGIGGDVQEVETLQQYIGVRFPARLPELEWLHVPVIALAALLLAGAYAGSGTIARVVRIGTVAVFVLFLAGSAAIVQKRLYDVGHERDPHAPIKAVKNFTPPLVGPAKVGNFTVWSFPHVGGLALATAAALASVAARRGAQ